MDKLKNCPFCGYILPFDEGVVDATYDEEGVMASPFIVSCSNCGAASCPGHTLFDAVEEWNKRVK